MFKKVILASAVTFLSVANANAMVKINEFSPNQPGSDPSTQTIELAGMAGSSFSGWFLSIESDDTDSRGTVDRATEISGTFDANGLLSVSIGDLENPSFTVALVDSFTGSTGTDYDVDNNAALDDLSIFGNVLDAIGVTDNTGDAALLYGTQLGGINFGFIGSEPVQMFRDSSTMDLYAVDFNGDVYDSSATLVDADLFDIDPSLTTFGSVNPTVSAVPVPAAAWLFGTAMLGMAGIRRKNGETSATLSMNNNHRYRLQTS